VGDDGTPNWLQLSLAAMFAVPGLLAVLAAARGTGPRGAARAGVLAVAVAATLAEPEAGPVALSAAAVLVAVLTVAARLRRVPETL
jgi:hypothetical protein